MRTWLEIVGIWFGLPLLGLALVRWDAQWSIAVIPTLWLGAIVGWLWLRQRHGWNWRRAWRWRIRARERRRVLLRFVLVAALLAAALAIIAPKQLLLLPREDPLQWVLILCFYTWISVLPQSVLWREVWFRRYQKALGSRWLAVWLGAAAFAWGHIVFDNLLIVGLTLMGGVMFNWTWLRTRSLCWTMIEHALYGLWLFTIGYSPWILAGSLKALDAVRQAVGLS
ncbi:MAG: CPBP family intramembrane metalloprotease [Phycisphaeraceae bacterium]|nr:CPBP family intramembrane metalloprotease [Phycisphaeraceae bacterium]